MERTILQTVRKYITFMHFITGYEGDFQRSYKLDAIRKLLCCSLYVSQRYEQFIRASHKPLMHLWRFGMELVASTLILTSKKDMWVLYNDLTVPPLIKLQNLYFWPNFQNNFYSKWQCVCYAIKLLLLFTNDEAEALSMDFFTTSQLTNCKKCIRSQNIFVLKL